MRRLLILFCLSGALAGGAGCALLPSGATDVPAAVVEVHAQETRTWAALRHDLDAEHEAVIVAYETALRRWNAELKAEQIAAATSAEGQVSTAELAEIEGKWSAAEGQNARIFSAYRAKWLELMGNYEMAMRLRAIVSSWMGALDALLEVGG